MMTTMTRIRTKSAGVEFPYAESYSSNRGSKATWSSHLGMNSKYYAGAKFDTIPSLCDLPPPPRHWTDPSTRSQSTPSSPVTISTKSAVSSAGISLDLGSLFGPGTLPSCDKSRNRKEKEGISKSASLPDQSEMNRVVKKKQGSLTSEFEPRAATAVFKTPQKKIKARPTVKIPTKPTTVMVTPKKSTGPMTPESIPAPVRDVKGTQGMDGSKTILVDGRTKATGISGLDLMEMLLRASPTHRQDLNSTPMSAALKKMTTPVKLSPCHLQLGSNDSQYKDISDHLKSILKVTA